jgi:aspartate aminotransferase
LSWKDQIKAQPMFDVLTAANLMQSKGDYVARMEIGDTTGFRNQEIHRLICEFSNSEFRYSPSQGEDNLIQAVWNSEWPRLDRAENSIIIAPANFLITAALTAVTSPGDVVLIPNPGFPTYELACNFLGLKVVQYDAVQFLSGNSEEFEKLHAMHKGKIKALIVNNPSNPLSFAQSGKVLEASLQKFQNLGVQIVFDETYVNLVYESVDPIINDVPAIRIRSFSKEHCAPGIRIGYALAPKEISKTMSDLISLTISCAPGFIQNAIAVYLNSDLAPKFTSSVREVMGDRLNLIKREIGVGNFILNPNSAFYAFIKVESGDRAFDFLLSNGVATCPGSKFGSLGNDFIRVSLAGNEFTFEKDVALLSHGLKRYYASISPHEPGA